jgi:hypothetical protein
MIINQNQEKMREQKEIIRKMEEQEKNIKYSIF